MTNEENKESKDFRTVLIAVDGSEHSFLVFDFYKNKIAREGDELVIVNVYQPPVVKGISLTASPSSFLSKSYLTEIQNTVEDAKNVLLKFKKLAEDNKMKHVVMLRPSEGNVGQTLCAIADELKPTILMVGSRGMGAVSRFLLGSVSDYVLHHAESTVCVVPQH